MSRSFTSDLDGSSGVAGGSPAPAALAPWPITLGPWLTEEALNTVLAGFLINPEHNYIRRAYAEEGFGLGMSLCPEGSEGLGFEVRRPFLW